MNKIYYLSTCSTCTRILKELNPPKGIALQDIKEEPLTRKELLELRELAGSYEALFSKRARLFRERNLHNQELEEKDFAELILEHYTFLKRPVVVCNQSIFIGNSKKSVAAAKECLHS